MPVRPIVAADGDTGPRGNYRKTTRTRARILDAALDVFGVSGFEGGSLREVAERAGISQAGLLHHYPSKIALLSAVVTRRDDTVRSQIVGRQSGVERLATFVDYARHSASQVGEIELFAVLSAEATRPEHPAHDYMRRRYQWVTQNISAAFEDARADGHLRDGVDPALVTSQLIALWDGLQVQWLLKVNDIDVAERLEHFLNLHLTAPLRTLVRTRTQGTGGHPAQGHALPAAAGDRS